ncbi:hypothetical protein [Actinoplanes utahensis]|uniref:Uncharacterized protein n=1 Tax=Actinoplanes utahensis TaxID=1869 RepID=A0A0A6UA40_ACTUT|nr:hypothetical protein [Actinoplanes utahensis]KHD72281.1 hypothetical protein MB27_41240 [Actinoplanes utahensis]GIF35568.1 hypothetical protein Aut01nite_85540 [Actinoplanes utahensis]
MHECSDGIPLRDPQGPLPPWWGFVLAVVLALPPFAGFPQLFHLMGGAVALTVTLLVEAAIVVATVAWFRRKIRDLPAGPFLAGILCPHGVQLTDPVSAGRLLTWPEIGDLQAVRAGLRTVVVVRPARSAGRTGLPPASRLVGHRAVPDDPAWLWLGFLLPFRVGRVRAAVETWRAVSSAPAGRLSG